MSSQTPSSITNRISHSHLGAWLRDCLTIYGVSEHVEAGGLVSYGPNFLDLLPARR